MVKLFLVEDHKIMRQSLVALLEREKDFVVMGEAESGEEAMTKVEDAKPDLLLIDISMPKMDGLTLLKSIRERWPNLRCLILSGHAESVYKEQAQDAGALAYIDKRRVREIVPTIRGVLENSAAA
jgi:DNA-binding NarL/FixJ family response regulator